MEAEFMSRIVHLQRQLHTTQLALKHYMINQNGGNGSNFNSLDSKEDHVSVNFHLFSPLLQCRLVILLSHTTVLSKQQKKKAKHVHMYGLLVLLSLISIYFWFS